MAEGAEIAGQAGGPQSKPWLFVLLPGNSELQRATQGKLCSCVQQDGIVPGRSQVSKVGPHAIICSHANFILRVQFL